MKVLFFIDSLRSGGKERRLVELIKGLVNDEHIEVAIVLTKKNIHYKEILDLGIKIHFAERKGMKKDPMFLKFYKIARKFKPDLIHVWGNMVAIYAIPAKILLRVPMINNQITNAQKNLPKSLLGHKLPFAFSNKIVANSFAGLKAYNAPTTKSSVIYNGFDFNRIDNLETKDNIRKMFNINTTYVIGMVASFSETKDYITYIHVAIKLLEQRKDVTFLCIGSGDSQEFETLLTPRNKERILFLGKQQDVESIMNTCDIGVLSTHGEGISNALLEFMALEKPVISNDIIGGTKELIAHDRNGYIVTPNDVIELAQKISYLLDNSVIRKDFGEQSKKIVQEKFNISNMIDEFRGLYKQTLKN